MFTNYSILHHRTRSATATAAIALLVLAVSLVATGCDRGQGGLGQDEPRDARQRMAAARSGIEWLIAHADRMPPSWAQPFLLRIHRVAPDDETAARIEAALRNDSAPSRRLELPENFEHPRILQPFRMTPILFELMRRKAVGAPYRDELEAVRRAMQANEGSFWKRVKPLQKSIYVYQLSELGLEAPFDLDTLYAEFRRELETRSIDDVARDTQSLYVLTHLVIARSMYLQTYVDESEFRPMLPYMMRALSENLGEGATTSNLDISAEILACLSLMKAPEDDQTAAARRTLMAAQNVDGSWGDLSEPKRNRVHATLVSILGTIVFPRTLRPDPDLAKRS